MARQIVGIGSTPNDGTGDPLRDSFDKTNDNFEELYNIHGWGYYQDQETAPATQVFDGTPQQLLIDGAGANSESGYLPRQIRGSSELWTSDKITPIELGDSYNVRLDIEVTATTSNPTRFDVSLDIGTTPDGTGGAGSILIVERSTTLKTGTPQKYSLGFPIFCLSTFLSNGGTFWISVNSGTMTVAGRGIVLVRTSKGAT